jgi:tRNA U54 and U55 pseudouridine synthase Pus10
VCRALALGSGSFAGRGGANAFGYDLRGGCSVLVTTAGAAMAAALAGAPGSTRSVFQAHFNRAAGAVAAGGAVEVGHDFSVAAPTELHARIHRAAHLALEACRRAAGADLSSLPSHLPSCSLADCVELRDAVKGLLSFRLRRLLVLGSEEQAALGPEESKAVQGPSDRMVLTVKAFEELVAQHAIASESASESAAAQSASEVGTGAGASEVGAHVDLDRTLVPADFGAGQAALRSLPSALLDRVYVDLGWGVSCLGADTGEAKCWWAEARADVDAELQARAGAQGAAAGAWGSVQVSQESSLRLVLTLATVDAAAADRMTAGRTAGGRELADGAPATAEEAGDALPAHTDKKPRLAATASPTASRRAIGCVSAHMDRMALFFKGRYCKYARGLAQSPWILEGRRLGPAGSVEEMLGGTLVHALTRTVFFPPAVYLGGDDERMVGPSFRPAGPEDLSSTAATRVAGASTLVSLVDAVTDLVARTEGRAVSKTADLLAALYAALSVSQSADPDGRQELFRKALPVHEVAYTFHSAGREDVDVRMLGDGRPFVIEVLNPRQAVLSARDFLRMQACEINPASARVGGLVSCRALAPASKEDFTMLQQGAEGKKKCYAAVCWTSRAHTPEELQAHFVRGGSGGGGVGLGERGDIRVTQWTPMRVLHRRPLLARAKVIHGMAAEWLDAHHFLLRLTTSAGTYVKEFVHGDRGRTTPSVGDLLGCEADILQLDVTGVIYSTGRDGEDENESDDE